MNQKDEWSDYWQNESPKGEVFVDGQGNKHEALSAFWRNQLSTNNAGEKLIDLACGAGSIFADLPQSHTYQLYAADLSAPALDTLKERFSGVETQVCSAADLPYGDGEFDAVVSQFGIEYAGNNAFSEALRILKSSGEMIVLSHIEDGFIDKQNQAELHGAQVIQQSRFIDVAIEVVVATSTNDERVIHQAMDAFTKVEPLIAATLGSAKRGVHVHLYNGFKQLFINRRAYTSDDIVNWLNAMKTEVQKSIERLVPMREAALSAKQVDTIHQNLVSQGASNVSFEPFILPEHTLPVAWLIRATKR